MIKIFGDKIDDQIFPKEIKRFTQEEKDLITNFVNSLLREDKKSELDKIEITPLYDRLDCCTETMDIIFRLKSVNEFRLIFTKYYRSGLKEKDYITHPDFMRDGREYSTENDYSDFKNELKKEKIITGIYVECISLIKSSKFLIGEMHEKSNFVIRTRYEDVERGGSNLTEKCKYRIKTFHFDKIFKIIEEENLKN